MSFDANSNRLRTDWSGARSDEPIRPPDDSTSQEGKEDSVASSEGMSAVGTNGHDYAIGEQVETQPATRDHDELSTIVWPESQEEDHQQFTLANLLTLLVIVSAGFATLQFTSLEVFAAGAGATAFALLVLLAVVPGSAMLRLAWWIALSTYLAASAMALM